MKKNYKKPSLLSTGLEESLNVYSVSGFCTGDGGFTPYEINACSPPAACTSICSTGSDSCTPGCTPEAAVTGNCPD